MQATTSEKTVDRHEKKERPAGEEGNLCASLASSYLWHRRTLFALVVLFLA